ncbi:MAG: PqqD family peptide modification chaperone [Acidimicrobiales bacterium]
MSNPARLVVPEDTIAAETLDGETVALDLVSGAYYSLAGVASDIWLLTAMGLTVDETVEVLVGRYDVDPETAEADVAALRSGLLEASLVEVADRAAPPAVRLDPPTASYATPELVTYHDMADLLALDPPLPGLSGMPTTDG